MATMSDCDFIPTPYREGRALRRAVKLRASGVGLLIAIMGVWVGANHHRLSSAQAMMAEVERQQQQIQIHLAKKQQMETERAALESRQRLVEQLEAGIDPVVVFCDISRRMPDTIVLTAVTASCPALARYAVREAAVSGQPPAGAEPLPHGRGSYGGDVEPLLHGRGSYPGGGSDRSPDEAADVDQITLVGVARELRDVITFAAALESSRLFKRVQMEMKESVVWSGRKAQSFEIRCDLTRQVGGRP